MCHTKPKHNNPYTNNHHTQNIHTVYIHIMVMHTISRMNAFCNFVFSSQFYERVMNSRGLKFMKVLRHQLAGTSQCLQ